MSDAKNELIDFEVSNVEDDRLLTIIRWWEKKRLVYNIIVVLSEIMMSILMINGVAYHGISYLLVGSAIFTFCANVSYASGWGIELLSKYYFPSQKMNENHRLILFILGTLFSIFVTMVVYFVALSLPF